MEAYAQQKYLRIFLSPEFQNKTHVRLKKDRIIFNKKNIKSCVSFKKMCSLNTPAEFGQIKICWDSHEDKSTYKMLPFISIAQMRDFIMMKKNKCFCELDKKGGSKEWTVSKLITLSSIRSASGSILLWFLLFHWIWRDNLTIDIAAK